MMEKNSIVLQNQREANRLILKGTQLATLLCLINFIIICVQKNGQLIFSDFFPLLAFILCAIPTFLYKKTKNDQLLKIYILITSELISTALFITGWLYASLLLLISFLIMSFYFEPQLIKYITLIKIPSLVLACVLSVFFFEGYTIEIGKGSASYVIIFFSLQLGLLGYLFYNLSHKTNRMMQAFIDKDQEVQSQHDRTIQGVKVITTRAQELGESITHNHAFVKAINEKAGEVKANAATLLRKATDSKAGIGGIFEEMMRAVDNANEISELTMQTRQLTEQNSQNMIELLAKINEISDSNNTSRAHFDRLLESTQEISNSIDLISQISKQTNLLSLNASIEAVRAGEHGRGFLVVANEIQRLADQTSQSAQLIGDIIRTMNQNVADYRVYIDHTETAIQENIEIIQKTNKDFDFMKQSQHHVINRIDKSQDFMENLKLKINEIYTMVEATYSQSEITEAEIAQVSDILKQLTDSFRFIEHATNDIHTTSTQLVEKKEA